MRGATLIQIFFVAALFLAGSVAVCHAQGLPADTSGNTRLERIPDSTEMRMTDTLTPRPLEQVVQHTPVNEDKPFSMSKSPSGAVWRSLVLPGWGQVYVEEYWKAPLFFGAAATTAYFFVRNHQRFSELDRRIRGSEEISDRELFVLRSNREFYRDNRDLAGISVLAVYLISAIDAYVGAHLYDFSVGDQASLNLFPARDGGFAARLELRW